MVRQYKILCPTCKGAGRISQVDAFSTTATIACPPCAGTGVVVATEILGDSFVESPKFEHQQMTFDDIII